MMHPEEQESVPVAQCEKEFKRNQNILRKVARFFIFASILHALWATVVPNWFPIHLPVLLFLGLRILVIQAKKFNIDASITHVAVHTVVVAAINSLAIPTIVAVRDLPPYHLIILFGSLIPLSLHYIKLFTPALYTPMVIHGVVAYLVNYGMYIAAVHPNSTTAVWNAHLWLLCLTSLSLVLHVLARAPVAANGKAQYQNLIAMLSKGKLFKANENANAANSVNEPMYLLPLRYSDVMKIKSAYQTAVAEQRPNLPAHKNSTPPITYAPQQVTQTAAIPSAPSICFFHSLPTTAMDGVLESLQPKPSAPLLHGSYQLPPQTFAV